MKLHILLFCLLGLFSCTRAEKEKTTRVNLVIPQFANKSVSSQITPYKLNPNGTITPSQLSEIECFGLLVSGPEDSLSRNVCNYKTGGAAFNVGFFAGGFYFAHASVARSKTVSIDIPSGTERSIKLIGFKLDTATITNLSLSPANICNQFFSNSSYETYLSDPYQIAEAGHLDMPAGGTRDVAMTAALDLNLKIGDCKGPDFQKGGGGSSGGPPAKIGIMFQDGIGISGANKPLASNSCVAVKFQLQDVNGNRADLTGNPQISSTIKMYYTPFNIGDFYSISDPLLCGGTPLNSGTTPLAINFSNAGTAFSDLILFFKPYGNPSATHAIEVTSTNGVALSTFNFDFSSSTSPVIKYGFLDVYNNTSTGGANSTALRSTVQTNTCRYGVLQFLDSNNVPSQLFTPSIVNQITMYSTINPSADLTYFQSQSDCTGNVTPTSVNTYLLTASTLYYGYGRYFKINSAFAGNFSFQIQNTNIGGTNIILSGDTTFGDNFWNAAP